MTNFVEFFLFYVAFLPFNYVFAFRPYRFNGRQFRQYRLSLIT